MFTQEINVWTFCQLQRPRKESEADIRSFFRQKPAAARQTYDRRNFAESPDGYDRMNPHPLL
jgi:hypothetical protein